MKANEVCEITKNELRKYTYSTGVELFFRLLLTVFFMASRFVDHVVLG